MHHNNLIFWLDWTNSFVGLTQISLAHEIFDRKGLNKKHAVFLKELSLFSLFLLWHFPLGSKKWFVFDSIVLVEVTCDIFFLPKLCFFFIDFFFSILEFSMEIFLQAIKFSIFFFCLRSRGLDLLLPPRLFVLLFFQFLQHLIQFFDIAKIPLTIFAKLSIFF